jgi:signal transduction histidine kinase
MISGLPRSILSFASVSMVCLLGMTKAWSAPPKLDELTSEALKERYGEIEEELAGLAPLMMRTGLGSQGYRSRSLKDAGTIAVQIDFNERQSFDQVVLVPSIWRVGESSYQADGFPEEFRLLVGSGDEEGVEVAAFTEADGLLPRTAPVVVDCPGSEGNWIRLEARVLTPSFWSGLKVLQLSEVMVFDGGENVALGQRVTTSLSATKSQRTSASLLVDGQVPYLMDARSGSPSVAFVSEVGIKNGAGILIDLGGPMEVDGVALHRVDLGDTVPQSTVSDFGLPGTMVVEGAADRGFKKAILFGELGIKSVYEAGPILTLGFPVTEIRYVRLKIMEPYLRKSGEILAGKTQFGAAEIEVLSNGRNVALGKLFEAEFTGRGKTRMLSALSDGRNLYGDILSQREWMNQLARRHDLEVMLPAVREEMDLRYSSQIRNMRILAWSVALLLGVAVLVYLWGRLRRLRELAELRERLAADLHDELGANLHTIGLLSDMAEDSAKEKPEKLTTLLRRIRSETERSGEAVRRCSRLLLADKEYSGLIEDMERSARRIAGEAEHDLLVEGHEEIEKLPGPLLHDLYLFHKECLVNIGRHSEATAFKTHLQIKDCELRLRVEDNGRGLAGEEETLVPSSLKRRGKLLGGKITAGAGSGSGTKIELRLKLPKSRS